MAGTIEIADVRSVVRLLGELAVLPGNVTAKRRFLINGLSRLIDADVWAWTLSRIDDVGMPALFWLIDGGWDNERQRQIVMETNFAPEAKEVAGRLFLNVPDHRTQTRDQIMPSAEWYESGFFDKFRRAAGLDDFMFVLYPVGSGVFSTLSFHRRLGKAAFADRERCIVHLITSEIDWLHRTGSEVPASEQMVCLSPRLRQVLLMLMAGDSRKQIAAKLRLSEHTVTDYMKSLHKHFNVNSRGELLSKFINGGVIPPLPN